MTREPADDHKSESLGIRAAIFIIVCLLGAYLMGYVMASRADMPVAGMRIRSFRLPYLAMMYPPLAWMEAKSTGDTVALRTIQVTGGVSKVVDLVYIAKP